nr:hypothetical protein [Luteibacter aegosomatis]
MIEVVAQRFGSVADAPPVQGVGEGWDSEGRGQAHDDEDGEKFGKGEASMGMMGHGFGAVKSAECWTSRWGAE